MCCVGTVPSQRATCAERAEVLLAKGMARRGVCSADPGVLASRRGGCSADRGCLASRRGVCHGDPGRCASRRSVCHGDPGRCASRRFRSWRRSWAAPSRRCSAPSRSAPSLPRRWGRRARPLLCVMCSGRGKQCLKGQGAGCTAWCSVVLLLLSRVLQQPGGWAFAGGLRAAGMQRLQYQTMAHCRCKEISCNPCASSSYEGC